MEQVFVFYNIIIISNKKVMIIKFLLNNDTMDNICKIFVKNHHYIDG